MLKNRKNSQIVLSEKNLRDSEWLNPILVGGGQKCPPVLILEINQTHFGPKTRRGSDFIFILVLQLSAKKTRHHRSFKRKIFRFCRRKVMIFHTNLSKFLRKSKMIESNLPSFQKKTISPRGLMDFFVVSQAYLCLLSWIFP